MFTVEAVEEVNLAANRIVGKLNDDWQVTLKPMEIRTFILSTRLSSLD